MMEKKRWLWKRKSSEKSPAETESSASASCHSERYSDEQETLKESPNGSNHSPDVTSKAVSATEDVNDRSFCIEQSIEVSSKAPNTGNVNDCLLVEDNNHALENINNLKEGNINDGLKTLSEKSSAALVNVSTKEDLVKQHAKVAEEAIAGWEKAENEVAILKKQLEAATLRNSALEDRVTHLDSALKECVRQHRQTRDQQEQNIQAAVIKKTHELESAKQKLQRQLSKLRIKVDASNARYPTPVDFDLHKKIEFLEKENMALHHELLAQSEELEVRTIERDLSTQAAETASKQHLESIKKVAKLEAECRRLKAIACRGSSVNDHKSTMSSYCVESLTDGPSDSGERLNAAETDDHKMSSLQSDKCKPSCSDSWASALIAKLDQFKNEKSRQSPACTIDLMDDFLEMERLVALPDTKNECCQESVASNPCMYEENSLRAEFDLLTQHMADLKEKLGIVEAKKADLEMALMKSEDCIETSQLQLREAEKKLEELQRELNISLKSKQMTENELASMKAQAQNISSEVDSLQVEVEKERALSAEIAMKYKKLEEEIESKKQEEKLRSTTRSYSEMKIKQQEIAVAAGKLAECQKTIASLGNQLNSLATLEDFLVDTANIPGFSASASLIAQTGGETWR